jgi:hypothetical protein
MEEESVALESEQKGKEEEYKLKKKTLDLLPNAEKNIADLHVNISLCMKRCIEHVLCLRSTGSR